MSYTWIKTYTEILDDPKMGMLSDHLWRRVIELFLFAGKEGTGGRLPTIQIMAWKLHVEPADLAIDLLDIASTGIIQQTEDQATYEVVNFEKRQAALTVTERVQRFRNGETKKLQKSFIPVTDKEEDKEEDKEQRSPIFDIYEKEIGALTSMIAQELGEYADLPEDWLVHAFSEAVTNNVRKWSYVKAILKSWKAAGKMTSKKAEAIPEVDYPVYVAPVKTGPTMPNPKTMTAAERVKYGLVPA